MEVEGRVENFSGSSLRVLEARARWIVPGNHSVQYLWKRNWISIYEYQYQSIIVLPDQLPRIANFRGQRAFAVIVAVAVESEWKWIAAPEDEGER